MPSDRALESCEAGNSGLPLGDIGPAHPELDRLIAAIRDDREHGASFLTAEALRALSVAAFACPEDSRLRACLEEVACRLRSAKPSMAGLANATGSLLVTLLEMSPKDARRQATEVAADLNARLKAASETTSTNAAALLTDGTTVATCSYSSAVARTLLKARADGKEVRSLVFVPRHGAEAHGLRLASDLEAGGIQVRPIDAGITPRALAPADAVLLGADAVSPAVVVNGSPSLKLAWAARSLVPVSIVCETVKLTRQAVATPGYDSIPAALVETVITEKGAVSPGDVGRWMWESSGTAMV